MFCPQCGQRQAANEVRFCSSCGFPLDHVTELLARGGQLPALAHARGAKRMTARQKGVRQGALMMLSTFLIVPLVAILGAGLLRLPGELVAVTAVVCLMGGLLRMLYALFLEDDAVANEPAPAQQYVPPQSPPNYLSTHDRGAALPPAQSRPAAAYRPPRYNTGELVEPPPSSVTDHTTRLLDLEREERRDPQ